MEIPKPDPPSVEEYLHRLFVEHDADDSGDCTTEELMNLFRVSQIILCRKKSSRTTFLVSQNHILLPEDDTNFSARGSMLHNAAQFCVSALVQGMALGLTDEDLEAIAARADEDGSGAVSWEEFLPVGVLMLEDLFDGKNWDEEDTPWVRL